MTKPLPTIGPLRVLSADPPVFLTGIAGEDYLGVARVFAERFGDLDAGFIVFPTWTLERDGIPEAIRARHAAHVARYAHHRFHFMGNTPREAELLRAEGLRAEFLNKNFTVSKSFFHPVTGTAIDFDAIYNARFVTGKRHELAALVPRVAYLAYVEPEAERLTEFSALYGAAMTRSPGHRLLNMLQEGRPLAMNAADVNAALARAAVGLMLSATEGANYASMEYMLAGLPVVSTPSAGGRDVYFDPDFCVVCDPDPVAVRDAVAALRARNIPREQVRDRTFEKIVPARRRFLDLLDEAVVELGGKPRPRNVDWPFGNISGVPWGRYESHLTMFEQLQRAVLCRKLGLDPRMLEQVQLTAPEIGPVAGAIRARPGCRLLVFGCGNDSAFWEAVNAGGETVFLENSESWAAAVRQSLQSAGVHIVDYGTRLSDWRALLESPARLKMTLPPAVAARTWDVVLVDGPAGHEPDSPGRMKAIFAASNLVGRGGAVFVHDSEREVEAAYAARYLGRSKVFVEARGRALLQGYAF